MSYVDKVEAIFNAFQEQKKLKGGMLHYMVRISNIKYSFDSYSW